MENCFQCQLFRSKKCPFTNLPNLSDVPIFNPPSPVGIYLKNIYLWTNVVMLFSQKGTKKMFPPRIFTPPYGVYIYIFTLIFFRGGGTYGLMFYTLLVAETEHGLVKLRFGWPIYQIWPNEWDKSLGSIIRIRKKHRFFIYGSTIFSQTKLKSYCST